MAAVYTGGCPARRRFARFARCSLIWTILCGPDRLFRCL